VRITKIEVQKRRPDRRNIYADGEFLIGLHVETLLRSGLRIGDVIAQEQLATLHTHENLLAARTAALQYLSVRPRSEREIRDKLRDKEFAAPEIDQVVTALTRAGLINDHEFARTYIRNSMAVRPVGELQLRRKLLLLGVARPIIDEAIQEIGGQVDLNESATTLARQFLDRKRRSAQSGDPRKTKQQLIGFLSRRGYSWPVISSAIKSLMSLRTDEESSDE
jgi:regulatory protein